MFFKIASIKSPGGVISVRYFLGTARDIFNDMHVFILPYLMITIKLIMAIGVAVIYLRFFNAGGALKQMTPLDLIVNFLLSAILSDFILDKNTTLVDFTVIVLIYGLLLYTLNKLTMRTNVGRRIFIGVPHVIIKNGEIDADMMQRLHISAHDLALAMRRQQIKSMGEIEMAQIEPNGDFTIVKKGAKKYSVVVIDNGDIDEDALAKINRSEKWLRRELKKKKIHDIDEILVAQWHNNRLQIIKKKPANSTSKTPQKSR